MDGYASDPPALDDVSYTITLFKVARQPPDSDFRRARVTVLETRLVSVSIDRSYEDVYGFVVDPENLPLWAPGFALAVSKDAKGWMVATADGPVRIAFAESNEFGVADHHVTAITGELFSNRMRVVPNGDGAEVTFTLFRSLETSAEQFAEDARLVRDDLHTLKLLLEGP